MDFTTVKDYLEGLNAEWGLPACAVSVCVGHDNVFTHYVNAFPKDAYWICSVTKLFTSTLFCRLLERGVLHLEDEVADYLPEFREMFVKEPDCTLRPAKRATTLKHMITMCAGQEFFFSYDDIHGVRDRSTRNVMREIAKHPLFTDPGEVFRYSMGLDVIGGAMEVATGTRFSELLEQEICKPLGLCDTSFHPDSELRSRIVPLFRYDEGNKTMIPCSPNLNFQYSELYDSGGGGLCSTLEDVGLLAEALASGGTARNGYQLLKPETIDLMRTNQLTPSERSGLLLTNPWLGSYSYGLGVRTRINQEDGAQTPLGEFGWDGMNGAFFLADPKNQISIVYMQHVERMIPVYTDIAPRLRDLVYKCLDA